MTDSPSARSATVRRVREPAELDRLEELARQRTADGWQLVAVEWQRADDSSGDRATLQSTEVPYGLQVAHDFLHLEENPLEVETMILVLEGLVEDRPMTAIAEILNGRGLRNRDDATWTAAQVFALMPRIVEVAPDIFGTDNWRELRQERSTRRLQAV